MDAFEKWYFVTLIRLLLDRNLKIKLFKVCRFVYLHLPYEFFVKPLNVNKFETNQKMLFFSNKSYL